MNSTEELSKMYGKSQQDTKVMGLGCWKLGQDILFKDGKKRKLIHIEYRNMAVDLLRFDDGTELFTGDIKDNFDFKTNLGRGADEHDQTTDPDRNKNKRLPQMPQTH